MANQVNEIIEMYNQLTEENKRKFRGELNRIRTDELIKMLRRNLMPDPQQLGVIKALTVRARELNTDPVLLYTDIFQYGLIEGKREERRRRASQG